MSLSIPVDVQLKIFVQFLQYTIADIPDVILIWIHHLIHVDLYGNVILFLLLGIVLIVADTLDLDSSTIGLHAAVSGAHDVDVGSPAHNLVVGAEHEGVLWRQVVGDGQLRLLLCAVVDNVGNGGNGIGLEVARRDGVLLDEHATVVALTGDDGRGGTDVHAVAVGDGEVSALNHGLALVVGEGDGGLVSGLVIDIGGLGENEVGHQALDLLAYDGVGEVDDTGEVALTDDVYLLHTGLGVLGSGPCAGVLNALAGQSRGVDVCGSNDVILVLLLVVLDRLGSGIVVGVALDGIAPVEVGDVLLVDGELLLG